MRLIVCYPGYGHIELAENDVVTNGKFKGLNQRELFEQIMLEGYGGNVPAIFHAEYADGSVRRVSGEDRKALLDDPNVAEITVLAPIAGG